MWEGLADRVEFNKNLVHYELSQDGTVIATFKDGSTVEGLALIGSDGCWSHTRRQLLPHYSLKDSEARVIWGKADLTDDFVAALPSLARHGLGIFSTPKLKVLFESMRFDHSHSHVDEKLIPKDYFYYLCYPRKEALGLDDAQFLHLSNDEAGELAKQLTKDWDQSAQTPFQRVAPHAASVSRIPTATPDIPSWDDGGAVTLMGDAVHSSKLDCLGFRTCAFKRCHLLSCADESITSGTDSRARRHDRAQRRLPPWTAPGEVETKSHSARYRGRDETVREGHAGICSTGLGV